MPHTRVEQKAHTRQALLDTALRLLEDRSLDSLGLRELTREVGIVPTAFYRHFPDVASLGVALVEQCLGGLRTAVRAVRDGIADSDAVISRSLSVLVAQLHERREHFRFIARERHGGVAPVRRAIREQLDLSAAELATDLLTRRLPHVTALERWEAQDVRMLATLIVDHVVQTAAALLELPPGDEAAASDTIDMADRQLRLIALGSRHWPG
ncbi:TetR family transcriptional regulator [Dactylosporangium sp. NPDC000244]|uniref:TetR family transcriptional regulator n=1 Tax=Dactylosporangium sp. NPDC000244 TaxID=3154365 RepID=UPI00331927C8